MLKDLKEKEEITFLGDVGDKLLSGENMMIACNKITKIKTHLFVSFNDGCKENIFSGFQIF